MSFYINKPIRKLWFLKDLLLSKVREWGYSLQGKQVVHFLHIGKTGGTTIKEALRHNLITDNYFIKLHHHNFRLKDVPKGHKIIFFLRDPISRFISGFYSRKRMGRPRINNPWCPNEEIAFTQFNTPNELAKCLSSKEKNIKTTAISAMREIDHVKSHFLDWFNDKNYFLSRISDVLYIGFQETLNQDFMNIKKILHLPEFVELPKDEVKSHKNPSHYDKHLDYDAKQNLRKWYKEDYEFLELCKEKAKQIFKNQV